MVGGNRGGGTVLWSSAVLTVQRWSTARSSCRNQMSTKLLSRCNQLTVLTKIRLSQNSTATAGVWPCDLTQGRDLTVGIFKHHYYCRTAGLGVGHQSILFQGSDVCQALHLPLGHDQQSVFVMSFQRLKSSSSTAVRVWSTARLLHKRVMATVLHYRC